MTHEAERRAWLHLVKPGELDAHMASIGQAETNAGIVRDMFRSLPLAEGGKLLVHGCGSCQMLDYLSLSDLGNISFTFADLSPAMMEEGKGRLSKVNNATYDLLIDDIEHSDLVGHYDAVLLVLVLLHVDWRCALGNMLRLSPRRFYIIEQEQGPGVSSVTIKEKLLPSMEEYRVVSEMTLVLREELMSFMNSRGYRLQWSATRPVPGDKAMMGVVFERTA